MRSDDIVTNIEIEIAPIIRQNKSCRILHNTVDLSEGDGAPFSIVANKLAVVNISVFLSTWSRVKDGFFANLFPDIAVSCYSPFSHEVICSTGVFHDNRSSHHVVS